MSYCRFSTDNYKCDLYVYADMDGTFRTHVAASRYINDVVPRDVLNTNATAPIGGPHDGASFSDDTLEELAERLIALREIGYRFPDFVLECIREDIATPAEAEAREKRADG